MQINWTLVAVSFVLTWLIALSVPLATRYVFVRKPLSRKSATAVAASWSFLGWLAFRILNAAAGPQSDGSPATQGAVWIVVFFVARWVMVRGSDEPKPYKRPFSLRHTLIGLPRYDDTPGPQLSRAEIVMGLERMLSDPGTSEERRAWAAKRLAHFQPSEK